jgi:hypothetical protein
MNVKFALGTATFFFGAMLAVSAQADTLDTHHARHRRAHAEQADVPSRGMSMAEVQRRYGAPAEKLATAGGDTPRHPPINRWRYDGYTVYFERSRVIHTVMNASATPNS